MLTRVFYEEKCYIYNIFSTILQRILNGKLWRAITSK